MNINNPLSELKTVNRECYRRKLSREGYSCLEEFENKFFSFVCEKGGEVFFIACFDGDQKDEVFPDNARNLMDSEIAEWLSSPYNHFDNAVIHPVAWFMDDKETPLTTLLPGDANGGMREPTQEARYLKVAREFLSRGLPDLVLDTPSYDVLRFAYVDNKNDAVRFITCFSGEGFFEEPNSETYLSRLVSDAAEFITKNEQLHLLELEPSFDALSIMGNGDVACIRYHKDVEQKGKQMESYEQMMKRHRDKSNEASKEPAIFPMSTSRQFDKHLAEYLNAGHSVVNLVRAGRWFCGDKTAVEAWWDVLEYQQEELKAAMENRDFAIDAYYYEACNHEYCINYDGNTDKCCNTCKYCDITRGVLGCFRHTPNGASFGVTYEESEEEADNCWCDLWTPRHRGLTYEDLYGGVGEIDRVFESLS